MYGPLVVTLGFLALLVLAMAFLCAVFPDIAILAVPLGLVGILSGIGAFASAAAFCAARRRRAMLDTREQAQWRVRQGEQFLARHQQIIGRHSEHRGYQQWQQEERLRRRSLRDLIHDAEEDRR
jgi:membrane protein implicated in regulation of membrane protease activity